MSFDQLTFDNPAERFSHIAPQAQHQSFPGSDAELTPPADHGETSYRGTGRLTGRKALITGGDSGIGAAVAIAFAREGADVAITYLDAERADAERIGGLIESEGRKAILIPGDLRQRDFCRLLVAQTVEGLGGLDILVNNAGNQVYQKDFREFDEEELEKTLRTNIDAMFWLTKDALAHMGPGSTIINTTSVQAYKPSPILVDYASTKFAINGFTKGLAMQLAGEGIRVNAVAPGPIWTPLQVTEGQPPEKIESFGDNTALGRMGQPVELAPAYVFLASPESSYVVGETINVNGGLPTP
ncbi:SDR family oxidoreductase [Demequina sp. NBRC 110057]|uniref:SDR family oxidoreductase n=1 Tax=Demequina sp. NBRC 110057 TaxID=1570346 RepID=UPI000A03DED9|nr:SDR family oxidoreductase [Demequina sp. NBRC 110057]